VAVVHFENPLVAINTPWWQTPKWQVNGGNQSNGKRAMAVEPNPIV
jgi:hypothetical protein